MTTLRQQISEFQQKMLPNMPEEVLEIMLQSTKELTNSGIATRALQAGAQAPRFTLSDSNGTPVSLDELLAKGAVVINFYRGSWCPYCRLELAALDQIMLEMHAMGATLISISPNQPKKTAEFTADNPLSFAMLSDPNLKVAEQYGIVFDMAKKLIPVYQKLGIELPAFDGNNDWRLPIPATYIVRSNGTIAHAFIDPDYTRRMEPVDILDILARPDNRAQK
ncbi:MAG: peroxiredoxin-like family protein [Mariprofundales bacterium]|nr:peroxiredoxin-like family protein [Mariprofundales bacterium]